MGAALSLVADIGGTNTRVALAREGVVETGSIMRVANAGANGIAEVIHRYLDESGVSDRDVTGVCVAAAGPVRDGVARLTNLDWRVDPDVLRDVLTANRVAVLNDLQAQGYALGRIAPTHLTKITTGRTPHAAATRLVIGVGTGFNAAPVFDVGAAAALFVPPSECGHASLPQAGPESLPVLAALTEIHGFASVEEALSGRGLSNVHSALHGTETPAAEIMAALEAGQDEAKATIRLVVRFLGAVVGDLALAYLPFGGVYLVGGVARSLAPWLREFGFAQAMQDKARFGPFLEQFSVSVVTDDYAALTGCAVHLHQTAGA